MIFEPTFEQLGNFALAAAAVGTAAMGIVESVKVVTIAGWGLALIGFGAVKRHLGRDALAALEIVYGQSTFEQFLQGAWRKGAEELAKTLRNGLRMAVFAKDGTAAPGLITAYAQDPIAFAAAVKLLRAGSAGSSGGSGASLGREREAVAQLEAVIDPRVDAAVAAGRDLYVSAMQSIASGVALGGCLLAHLMLPAGEAPTFVVALVVGLLAVPIAPVAKDLVSFLSSLRTAFQKTKAAV